MTGSEREWPSRDEFRRMSAVQINDFFASQGIDLRVVDEFHVTTDDQLRMALRDKPAPSVDCTVARMGGFPCRVTPEADSDDGE